MIVVSVVKEQGHGEGFGEKGLWTLYLACSAATSMFAAFHLVAGQSGSLLVRDSKFCDASQDVMIGLCLSALVSEGSDAAVWMQPSHCDSD